MSGWRYADDRDQLEAERADPAPELGAALLRGYREVRPLSERHEALLDLFVATSITSEQVVAAGLEEQSCLEASVSGTGSGRVPLLGEGWTRCSLK